MRLVPLHSLEAAGLRAWNQLAGRAVEPNPFFEASFVTTAAGALKATEQVQLLLAERDDTWVGCMPVLVSRMLGRAVLLSSWKHPYSFLGTPLVDRDHVDEFAEAFIRMVAAGTNGRFAMLRRCSDDVVLRAIRRSAGRTGLRTVFEHADERALLKRREAPNYLDGVRPHHRREMRRLKRRLGEELGEELGVHDRTDDPAAIEEFLGLEASGWKGREGTAMAQSTESADLFRAICTDFAAEGRLQLLSLEAGGRVAAMKCNISAGDTLFCFKIAFDEGLKRYSPGIQLEIENVDLFHGRHESQMDSCAEPTNEMINRLWPDRRAIVTLALGPGGPLGWLGGRALNTAYTNRMRRTAPSTLN